MPKKQPTPNRDRTREDAILEIAADLAKVHAEINRIDELTGLGKMGRITHSKLHPGLDKRRLELLDALVGFGF